MTHEQTFFIRIYGYDGCIRFWQTASRRYVCRKRQQYTLCPRSIAQWEN